MAIGLYIMPLSVNESQNNQCSYVTDDRRCVARINGGDDTRISSPLPSLPTSPAFSSLILTFILQNIQLDYLQESAVNSAAGGFRVLGLSPSRN